VTSGTERIVHAPDVGETNRELAPARLWLLILIGCIVAGFLDSLQAYLQGYVGGGGHGDWGYVLFQGSEWLFLAALTLITYWLGRRFPLQRPHWKLRLLIHFTGALVLCLGWASMGVTLRRGLNPKDPPFAQDFASWVLTSLPWSVFMYFAVLGCVHAFSYYVESRRRAEQAAALSAQLSEARLSALRMQLNPHFLFNSLNAITVLVRDQRTQLAGRMLELLSDVLRQVLRPDQPHEVPLEEELQLIRQYLAIEEVRFSDRLTVRFAIDESVRRAAVPRFILQPLVENALRYGVADRTDLATVEIGAARVGADLHLWVRDDGPGLTQEARGQGLGLQNTRLRLATLHGERATLTLSTSPEGGTESRIVLPYRDV
jgi:signal transduction histidine kinase